MVGRLEALRPSMSEICLGWYSFEPRKTNAFGQSAYASSWTRAWGVSDRQIGPRITHHGAESDQADEGIGREEAERGHKGLAESVELVLVNASVDDVEEDGRHRGRARESVLDGRVLWQQLGRQVGLRDLLVVRRERVTLKTERADPHFAADINLAVKRLAVLHTCTDKPDTYQ
jgi:hypothetical protein